MRVRSGAVFWAYVALAVAGTLLPYSAFLPWVATNGLDVPLFVSELFANRISSFFGWVVIIASIVLIVFVSVQGRRDRVAGAWIAIVAGLSVGVSAGLPLFLALRERTLAARA